MNEHDHDHHHGAPHSHDSAPVGQTEPGFRARLAHVFRPHFHDRAGHPTRPFS